MITDSIGLNPTLNLVLMSGIQVVAVLILNFAVPYIKRRFTSVAMAFIGLVISLLLLPVKVPSNCEDCPLAVLQIGLVMVAKFCIGLMLGLFFVAQS